ncbi:MAG: hypothetical protein ACR2OV_16485 [Hyphomicrobiaceae bacterium]
MSGRSAPDNADKNADSDSDTRIAPDPFTAVLPALAALGAIASIATVNWVAHDVSPERARSKRKVVVALRDLEKCCLGLQEIFKRFHKAKKLFAGEGAASSSPLKFGVHGPRVGPGAIRIYHQSINDVASMLVLASQNAFEVMAAIEDGEIDPPEEVFYGFGEAQDQLNKLIQDRETLKGSVEKGLEVAVKLTGLVRQLKDFRPQ